MTPPAAAATLETPHSDPIAEPLRLAPELAGISLTPAEFDALDEAEPGYRYELIHGVVVVTPAPRESERDPNEELGHFLRTYRDTHPQGAALDATLSEQDIRLPSGNRRRADRVIWAGLGRRPDPRVDSPTIVVEFVSRGRRSWIRDYEQKRDEYHAAGIAEDWVIDRFQRTLTVFQPAQPPIVIAPPATYQTPRLPGFNLALDPLFTAAARWPDAE